MSKRLFILVLILIFIIGFIFLWFKDATSPVNSKDKTNISFSIEQGQSIKEIANNLKEDDLIKDKVAFFSYIRFSNLGKKIQAGNFNLNKSMSAIEIANELTHGTSDVWIQLIEGWRVEEAAAEISKNLLIPESEFIKLAKEGYVFPDTYLIPKEATAGQALKVIEDNFNQKVDSEIIQRANQQGLTLNQVITLASIIEREVKDDNDRQIVAGILLKRLKEGWPLQADATIQYALGYQSAGKTWWKKDLTIEDLKTDSLYNTYLYSGFPPGPIASPGLSAIKAVVSPQDSDYWFYISDNKGFIHYAKTQEEQDANIEKYLR